MPDPFYRTFTHSTEAKLRQIANTAKPILKRDLSGFLKYTYAPDVLQALLDCVPSSRELGFTSVGIQLFVTNPNYYYRPHKDGANLRFGINYVLSTGQVNDCLTSWYREEAIEHIAKINSISNGVVTSRELDIKQPGEVVPACSEVFRMSDGAILFNTDMYHDFYMRESSSPRHLLVFRSNKGFTYTDAVHILKSDSTVTWQEKR